MSLNLLLCKLEGTQEWRNIWILSEKICIRLRQINYVNAYKRQEFPNVWQKCVVCEEIYQITFFNCFVIFKVIFFRATSSIFACQNALCLGEGVIIKLVFITHDLETWDSLSTISSPQDDTIGYLVLLDQQRCFKSAKFSEKIFFSVFEEIRHIRVLLQ